MALNSYDQFLQEAGISKQLDDAVRNYTDDLDLRDIEGVYLAGSCIDGTGLFASKSYSPCFGIGWGRINEKRTIIGRYTNHSDDPNCTVIPTVYGVMLVTLKAINAGDELTIDYRDALNAND